MVATLEGHNTHAQHTALVKNQSRSVSAHQHSAHTQRQGHVLPTPRHHPCSRHLGHLDSVVRAGRLRQPWWQAQAGAGLSLSSWAAPTCGPHKQMTRLTCRAWLHSMLASKHSIWCGPVQAQTHRAADTVHVVHTQGGRSCTRLHAAVAQHAEASSGGARLTSTMLLRSITSKEGHTH